MTVLDEKVKNIKERIEHLQKLIECGEAEKVPDSWVVDRLKELNDAMSELKKLES